MLVCSSVHSTVILALCIETAEAITVNARRTLARVYIDRMRAAHTPVFELLGRFWVFCPSRVKRWTDLVKFGLKSTFGRLLNAKFSQLVQA